MMMNTMRKIIFKTDDGNETGEEKTYMYKGRLGSGQDNHILVIS